MIKIIGEQTKQKYNCRIQLQLAFKIGNKVLICHDNINKTTPSKKLATKFLGSFPIISKLSDVVYSLKLPRIFCIHDVFHVFLLKRYRESTITSQHQKPLLPVVIPKEPLSGKSMKF